MQFFVLEVEGTANEIINSGFKKNKRKHFFTLFKIKS